MTKATPQLITALDVPTRKEAEALVEQIDDRGVFFKIGYQLIYGDDGLGLAKALKSAGKKIFCDVKLLDIPNTVEKGVAGLVELGADIVTIHAEPHCMAAAKRAAEGSKTKLMGVTVMTSLDDEDLKASGYAYGVRDLVERRAKQAAGEGIDGVICSAHEIELVKQASGGKLMAVTPGIRPAGSAADDQKRILTPTQAIEMGADQLVVGRPIYRADDPYVAAGAVNDEIQNANQKITTFRAADAHDADALSAIEENAAFVFKQLGGAFTEIDLSALTPAFYSDAIAQNQIIWLVELRGQPVGFLRAKPIDDLLYCAELSVLRHHHGKGLGEKLLNHFVGFAQSEGFAGVAGITFKNVPWNGPYYLKQGFEYWSHDMIGPELKDITTGAPELALSKAGERVVFGKRF